jgi:hypothetical protein
MQAFGIAGHHYYFSLTLELHLATFVSGRAYAVQFVLVRCGKQA